jgi:hypothetical protein
MILRANRRNRLGVTVLRTKRGVECYLSAMFIQKHNLGEFTRVLVHVNDEHGTLTLIFTNDVLAEYQGERGSTASLYRGSGRNGGSRQIICPHGTPLRLGPHWDVTAEGNKVTLPHGYEGAKA